jgi:ribonuclease HII
LNGVSVEQRAILRSYPYLVGVDEAGRGPLAGPVVSSCAYLTQSVQAKDSKQLSPEQRKRIYARLQKYSLYSFGFASAGEIDQINIYQATLRSFDRAIEAFLKKYSLPPDKTLFVIDGPPVPLSAKVQYICIEKADEHLEPVSAASILAKVTRDHFSELMHLLYPEYLFNKHRGYGTKEHRRALRKRGYSPLHRKSFTVHNFR